MGVMLSLDRYRPAGGRRRAQHARRHDRRVRMQPADMRRSSMPVSVGLLGRLTRAVLARRGRAAARSVPPGDLPGERAWSRYPGMSVACLLGECRDEAVQQACEAGACECECHSGAVTPGSGPGAGRAPAA